MILETKDWYHYESMTEWGYEEVFVCPLCSAMVHNPETHRNYHVMTEIPE
jgi:hypothetical protein